tara:strand:+ start:165 stop:890 length:726 start_codon:yes stop_codon:yes gene_type:complete
MKTLLILLAFILPNVVFGQPAPVTVFAAASLRGALDEVAEGFGAGVSVSYGGSGTMARQIDAGAPADVVILAAPVWMDWLQERGILGDAPQTYLLGNRLVLVAPADSTIAPDPGNLAASLGDARLVIGQRDAVPAGIYAREWLQTTKQWDALQHMLAETDNVRTALALVARGEMPLGVVYRTDAMAEPKVRVVYTVPDDQHNPITYPAAALTDAGKVFLQYLQTDESMGIFAAHGFMPVTP